MYSIDFRRKAVEYKRKGHTFKELEEVFGIIDTTYYRWSKEYDNGFPKDTTPRERSRKIDKEKLRQAVEEKPDACLSELAALFEYTPQAVFYALGKMNITHKKTFTYSEKSEIERAIFLEKLAEIPEEERVYIDESGVNQYYQREHGWAARGVKIAGIKHGRKFQRKNVIGGMCGSKYLAMQCYEGTTTSAFFEDWFEQVLIPETPEGCTIILNNASFHRKAHLLRVAFKMGVRLLFLPTYSPDINRIEHAWTNLKRWLKDNMRNHKYLTCAIFEFFDDSA